VPIASAAATRAIRARVTRRTDHLVEFTGAHFQSARTGNREVGNSNVAQELQCRRAQPLSGLRVFNIGSKLEEVRHEIFFVCTQVV